MTLLAGIVALREGTEVAEDSRTQLIEALSRGGDKPFRFDSPNAFMVKVDIGAYGTPSLVDDGHATTMVVGDPLLPAGEHGTRDRGDDSRQLHSNFLMGRWALLAKARGTFAAVHLNRDTESLYLIADRLAIRPVYYWIGASHIVFASALRVLESLPLVPKERSLRGTAEQACFGFPLGDRTPYQGIRRLQASEVVKIARTGVTNHVYWRWDRLPDPPATETDPHSRLAGIFHDAIRLRLGTDSEAVAFLSGGLDSRVVVSVLRDLGTTVHAFNFAPPDSLDQYCARQFARAIGAQYEEFPGDFTGPFSWSMFMSNALRESGLVNRGIRGRVRIAWTGDGGSVGLGHVYLTRRIVDLMRRGDVERAVTDYLENERCALPLRFAHPNVKKHFAIIPSDGVLKELRGLDSSDPGRNFHLFLMLNDQQRHLTEHFEDIDMHRVELHLPFFDAEVLQFALCRPVDEFLQHHFYSEWLRRLRPEVTNVAWQTYPGHVPCPIPLPAHLRYQWNRSKFTAYARGRKKRLLKMAARTLRCTGFPDDALRRGRFRLALLAYRLGLRDYGYLVHTANVFRRYQGNQQCPGN